MATDAGISATGGVVGTEGYRRRRGLSTAAAVALAPTAGVIGGAIDVATGMGLRTGFAVSFIAGCALSAALVRREHLVAAVVMPPLLYVVLALGAAAVQSSGAVDGFVKRQLLELATALVLGAPVLLAATGLAFLIAVGRALMRGRH